MSSNCAMDRSEFAGLGSNSKDFGKKKRGNRYAKLKQSKLDARREQWLAQVKIKGSKEESENDCEVWVGGRRKKGVLDLKDVEVKRVGEEKNGLIHHRNGDWDLSPSNSPGSLLASISSGTNFSGCSGSSISSGGFGSGSIAEEDEDNDGCLDDWEAVADALGVGDKSVDPIYEPAVCQQDPSRGVSSEGNSLGKGPRPGLKIPVNLGGCQAWKPDDAYRPQSLPNLVKQHSFHMKHGGCGSWVCSNVMSVPSSCPICYEDLDKTDTCFLPCSCGFRVCLFCHKRILEEDGRCPGCRKSYETNGLVEGEPNLNEETSSIWLARSFSMTTGSRI